MPIDKALLKSLSQMDGLYAYNRLLGRPEGKYLEATYKDYYDNGSAGIEFAAKSLLNAASYTPLSPYSGLFNLTSGISDLAYDIYKRAKYGENGGALPFENVSNADIAEDIVNLVPYFNVSRKVKDGLKSISKKRNGLGSTYNLNIDNTWNNVKDAIIGGHKSIKEYNEYIRWRQDEAYNSSIKNRRYGSTPKVSTPIQFRPQKPIQFNIGRKQIMFNNLYTNTL